MKFFSCVAMALLACGGWAHAEVPASQVANSETRIAAAALIAKKDFTRIADSARIENGDLLWTGDGVELEMSLVRFGMPDAFRVNGAVIALPARGVGRLLLATVQTHVIPEGQLRARIYLASRSLVDSDSRSAIGDALFGGVHPAGQLGGVLVWSAPSPRSTMMPVGDDVDAFLKCVEGCVKAGGDSKACPEACAKVVTGK